MSTKKIHALIIISCGIIHSWASFGSQQGLDQVREELSDAIRGGNRETVDSIVETYGDQILNQPDEAGLKPIMEAALHGHLDIVRSLERRAEALTDEDLEKLRKEGMTRKVSDLTKREKAIHYLQELSRLPFYDSDEEKSDESDDEDVPGEWESQQDLDQVREELSDAIWGGDRKTVDSIVETYGNQILNQPDEAGLKPIMEAALHGHLDIVRSLGRRAEALTDKDLEMLTEKSMTWGTVSAKDSQKREEAVDYLQKLSRRPFYDSDEESSDESDDEDEPGEWVVFGSQEYGRPHGLRPSPQEQERLKALPERQSERARAIEKQKREAAEIEKQEQARAMHKEALRRMEEEDEQRLADEEEYDIIQEDAAAPVSSENPGVASDLWRFVKYGMCL